MSCMPNHNDVLYAQSSYRERYGQSCGSSSQSRPGAAVKRRPVYCPQTQRMSGAGWGQGHRRCGRGAWAPASWLKVGALALNTPLWHPLQPQRLHIGCRLGVRAHSEPQQIQPDATFSEPAVPPRAGWAISYLGPPVPKQRPFRSNCLSRNHTCVPLELHLCCERKSEQEYISDVRMDCQCRPGEIHCPFAPRSSLGMCVHCVRNTHPFRGPHFDRNTGPIPLLCVCSWIYIRRFTVF